MGQPDQPVAMLSKLGWYLIGDDRAQTPRVQGIESHPQAPRKETVSKRPPRKPRNRKSESQRGPTAPSGPSQVDRSDPESSASDEEKESYESMICLIDSEKDEIMQAIQRMYQHDFIGRPSEDHSPGQTHFSQADEFAIKQRRSRSLSTKSAVNTNSLCPGSMAE